MQDLQTDNTDRPIYEHDTNILINRIFDRNNNHVYKTEFLEQLETELTAKKKHLEKWIEDNAIDELLERKARFAALAEPCNKLYYNKFFIENSGSVKDIWLTKDWKKSEYFNAIVCIQFLQYQQNKINELEIIPESKSKTYITPKEFSVLFHLLRIGGIIRPKVFHSNESKQAEFVAMLFGIEWDNKFKDTATSKHWYKANREKYVNEYFTLPILRKIEKYIMLSDNPKLLSEYKKRLEKAIIFSDIQKVHRGI